MAANAEPSPFVLIRGPFGWDSRWKTSRTFHLAAYPARKARSPTFLMSLFEWFGESFDPGPSGETHFGPRDRGRRSRANVLIRSGISLGLLGGLGYLMHQEMGIRDVAIYRNTAVGVFFYSFVAYFVHPEPDTSNMGMFGGLMDHPLRYSDDVNRFLLFFLVILLPGRFLSEALVDLLRLIRHAGRRPPPQGS